MPLLISQDKLPEALKNTICDVCGIIENSFINLNLHMKNMHSETDSERLHRTEQLLLSVANQKQESYKSPPIKIFSFDCTECGISFKNMEDMKLHFETVHRIKWVIKIEPDTEFLIQNTKDLEKMLKALPLETFYSTVEELNQDFSDILNEKIDLKEDDNKNSLICGSCKFRASSKKGS